MLWMIRLPVIKLSIFEGLRFPFNSKLFSNTSSDLFQFQENDVVKNHFPNLSAILNLALRFELFKADSGLLL